MSAIIGIFINTMSKINRLTKKESNSKFKHSILFFMFGSQACILNNSMGMPSHKNHVEMFRLNYLNKHC